MIHLFKNHLIHSVYQVAVAHRTSNQPKKKGKQQQSQASKNAMSGRGADANESMPATSFASLLQVGRMKDPADIEFSVGLLKKVRNV